MSEFLDPGTLLRSRYRILDVIGEGAMSAVYLVEDTAIPGARWAMKELHVRDLPLEEGKEALELFSREARILKSLEHPGIPLILDFFSESPHLHYMVMDYIQGATLHEIIDRHRKPFIEEELLPLALQISSCLKYLHERPQPVIFRDLKPSNIMVNKDGKIKLIDFGIARIFSPAKTKDTCIIGTPGFCAPEQYGTSQTDARSDIYSFGATLFFLLSCQDTAAYNFEFPLLADINPDVTRDLAHIIARCVEKEPERRFQTMHDVHQVLVAHLCALSPSSPLVSQRTLKGDLRFFRNWFLRTFLMKTPLARPKTGKLRP
jgi:serine/threonine-protein kinase